MRKGKLYLCVFKAASASRAVVPSSHSCKISNYAHPSLVPAFIHRWSGRKAWLPHIPGRLISSPVAAISSSVWRKALLTQIEVELTSSPIAVAALPWYCDTWASSHTHSDSASSSPFLFLSHNHPHPLHHHPFHDYDHARRTSFPVCSHSSLPLHHHHHCPGLRCHHCHCCPPHSNSRQTP